MKATELFVFFCTFAFSYVNSSVACSANVSAVICTIEDNVFENIHDTIAAYLGNGETLLEIIFGIDSVGALLDIQLPESVTHLFIRNGEVGDIYVQSNNENRGVRFITFTDYRVGIIQDNFFKSFPNLEIFEANELVLTFAQILTNNTKLTKFSIEQAMISHQPDRVINPNSFAGLEKLEFLKYKASGITEIKAGSFKDLTNLRELYLDDNEIKSLESCTFEGLENLEILSLSGNGINTVFSHAFNCLSKLSKLVLSQNPSMHLHSVTALKALQILQLNEIDSTNVLPEIIQQLTNLTTLDLSYVVFDCTCDTEWISKLASFDISVSFGITTCYGNSEQANEPLLYSDCSDRSFQCFNKSIKCVGENWDRITTPDGCDCIYPNASYTFSQICNDTNECEDSSICQGNCINTIGSYRCHCLEGFYYMNDTLCADINECLFDNGNCAQDCSNTIGSYECSCGVGYLKNGSNACVDINECLLENGNCTQDCSNTIGSYECSCGVGYLKNGSYACVDINECLLENGNCTQDCSNTIGSYECSCGVGYLKNGSYACDDINECLLDNGNCAQDCSNTIGSYECSCGGGYLKNGSNACIDINECLLDNGNCAQDCSNTLGSYECSCGVGYLKNGSNACVDINECLLDNGNCTQDCSNTLGSYECSCGGGYLKNGSYACIDINECLLDNGNCAQDCSNTLGSYECSCLPGYMQIGSTGCSLPNTCSHNNGGCHHNCIDSLDGYVCSCLEGFKVSLLNSSHCEVDAVTGNNANSKESSFYVLLFVCFLFLATIILLFVLLILLFLYFRKQLQSVNAKLASEGIVLTQLEGKPETASPQLDSSPNQQEPAREPSETFNNVSLSAN